MSKDCTCGRPSQVYAMEPGYDGWADYYCWKCAPQGWSVGPIAEEVKRLAELFRGDHTTLVLDGAESKALQMVLADWIDDSYTRGVECNDESVIFSYRKTRETLVEVFETFGPYVWPEGS